MAKHLYLPARNILQRHRLHSAHTGKLNQLRLSLRLQLAKTSCNGRIISRQCAALDGIQQPCLPHLNGLQRFLYRFQLVLLP
ncbi:hypothetical protein [Vogesella indigofera]|uniref:hypothetical protein n=1 Tax=Vogesella indigofera TaxID=45465 RepID=UPI00234CA5A7|nr:hypothetical protein [Vogesella indigofera]MDC7704998.1 hypothetical protein [Vogesella indigofera]